MEKWGRSTVPILMLMGTLDCPHSSHVFAVADVERLYTAVGRKLP
jgi:hypothetical protein